MRHAYLPFLLASTLAPAQNAALPIGDLLLTACERDAYVAPWRPVPARVLFGEADLGAIHRGDDERAVRDTGVRGHFHADQMLAVLEALGFRHPVTIRGNELLLAAGGEPEARKLLDELRRRVPQPLTVDVRLLRTRQGRTETLLARTLDVMPGRLAVASDSVRRLAVVDYQVEIAQESSIANPDMREVRSGAMVALRASLSPQGDVAVFDVVARHVDEDATAVIDTGYPGLGPIDRATMRIAEIGRVLRLRPGTAVAQRWASADATYELTLQAQWRPPAHLRPGGQDFALFALRGCGNGFRTVATDADRDDASQEPECEETWADPTALAGGEAAWLGDGHSDRGPDWQVFAATGPSMWAIQAAAMAWFERLREGPRLELHWFDAAADVVWPADGTAPDGARPVGHAALDLVDGAWAATAIRTEHTVLVDWDVEVASASRIPDPRCRRVDQGLWCNVRAIGDQLELDSGLQTVLDPGRKQLRLSMPVLAHDTSVAVPPAGGSSAAPAATATPFVKLLPDVVAVEHPLLGTVPIQFLGTLTKGAAIVRRASAERLLGTGRDLVLVVKRSQ
jgi:hypothetical protein